LILLTLISGLFLLLLSALFWVVVGLMTPRKGCTLRDLHEKEK
jgi:hypothetical protein